MSDALSKLIRLSNRHQLPVIVHDSESGESAVLMNLDEYENLAQLREECDEDDWGLPGLEDDDLDESELDFEENFPGESRVPKVDQTQFWHEAFTSGFEAAESASVSSPTNWDMPATPEKKRNFIDNVDEPRYESADRGLYPAFSPQEPDDDEPIFFEEPV